MPSQQKHTLGGSFNNPRFKKALRVFGLAEITQRNKYAKVATDLGITPMKRTAQGNITNRPIKVGTQAWKDAIEREVIRRYEASPQFRTAQLSQAIANQARNIQTQANTKQRVAPMLRQIKQAFKNKPRITNIKVIDKHGFYIKYYVELSGVNSLEQLYPLLVKEITRLGGISFITLIFVSNQTGRPRGLSINANYLDTLEDFLARVDELVKGEVVGSDPFDLNEYELVLDAFHIGRTTIAQVNGKSQSIVFENVGIESKDNYCGYECLKELGHEYKGKKAVLRSVKEMSSYIQTNNLPYNILCNSFQITKPFKDIVEAGDKQRIQVERKKGRKELRICSRVLMNDYQPVYLYKYEGEVKGTIIYDEIEGHFDLLSTKEPRLKDNVLLSLSCEVIMNEKILFQPKQANINTFRKSTGAFRYLIFDYETVIDFTQSSCMKPYSLSVLELDEVEIELLEEWDRKKDLDNIKAIRKTNCKTFLGYDCNTQFIRWFLEKQKDMTYSFVGFNNANFDNFLLLDGLLRFNQFDEQADFQVGNVFYNGSQLLNFYINGRHSCFDIKKHLVGSLDANCKSFKINCCAKKSFDHSLAQSLHQEDGLIDFITNNDELREYNEYDVLATAVLFQKYRNALADIPSTAKYAKDLKSTITIGSLIYKVFNDHISTMRKDDGKGGQQRMFGKLKWEHYRDLQKSKIAGRVELFNGVQQILERMGSTDVCSLYPFVMAVLNVYYPCGEIEEVDDYRGDDELGFYYCDIDQSNLRENNLPKIYAFKTEIENNWGHEQVLQDYLISNVMIGLLRKYGCDVVVKKGFIFDSKERSCDMFSFLLEMMGKKNDQDALKGQDGYNPALRETLKLLMNSLSGKVIEGLHTEKTTDIDNAYDYAKIQDKAKSINFINSIGNKLFITYEMDEEKICEAQQRPIFLGVLVYDYAKRYMYENSYSKIGLKDLVYTDTDASKFRYSAMERWTDWINKENVIVPHWKDVEKIDPRYETHLIYNPHSKVFGSFEDELDEIQAHSYKFYCVEKKSWAYLAFDENGEYIKDKDGKHISKFKFKGINGGAIIMDMDEPFIEEHIIKKKDKSMVLKYSISEDMENEVYCYATKNKHKSIENGNIDKFFNRLFTDKEAYVLTNSFRKIVKNSAHNVDMGDEEKYNGLMNKIQVNYSLKHLQLKN
jgi:hypothetical protein